mmetsp:Transcript_23520/g.56968  ORF Transcript_23520/g.56968 Transcript_23520/m.56968 type:complete len:94 (+) Transcript_23520:1047-1328(+)
MYWKATHIQENFLFGCNAPSLRSDFLARLPRPRLSLLGLHPPCLDEAEAAEPAAAARLTQVDIEEEEEEEDEEREFGEEVDVAEAGEHGLSAA